MTETMHLLFEEWATKRGMKIQLTKEGRYLSKDTFIAFNAWEGAYSALLGSKADPAIKDPLREVLLGTLVSIQLSDDDSEKGLKFLGTVDKVTTNDFFKNSAVLLVKNPSTQGEVDPRVARQKKLMETSQEILDQVFKLGQESKEAAINDSLETVVEIDVQLMKIKEKFRLATEKPDFSDPNVYENNDE